MHMPKQAKFVKLPSSIHKISQNHNNFHIVSETSVRIFVSHLVSPSTRDTLSSCPIWLTMRALHLQGPTSHYNSAKCPC